MISIQEKVNLSFFFISTYEKIIEILKPFGVVINEVYQNEGECLSYYVRSLLGKFTNKNYI